MKKFLLAILVLCGAAFPAMAQFEYAGATVRQIDYRADGPIDRVHLDELNPIDSGSVLSIRSVQNAIENLYSVGDFRDVRVDGTRTGDSIDLTFILSIAYRVGTIEVEGAETLTKEARGEYAIRSAEVLSLNAVDRSAIEIQQMLARRGYQESTVDPETIFVRAENRANVIFHVTLGPQARISAIDIEGNPSPFTTQQILETMKRKVGDVFQPDEARREVDRVRRFLVRRQYRRAEVRYIGETYDPATDSARLTYRVVTGPLVRVEVTGVSRRSVRRLIPFRRDEAYSEDLIDRAADRIVTSLQQRGNFLGAVNTEEKLENGEWIITFEVEPGRRFRLDEVDFQGNSQISDKELRGVIATAPQGGVKTLLSRLFRRPAGVTQAQLGSDQESLQSFYQLAGFSEAQVGTPVATPSADGTLDVAYPIKEGPRTLVSDIRMEGLVAVKPGDLPPLQLKKGDPLNPLALNNDRVTIASYYSTLGYAEVQVAPAVTYNVDKTSAELTYRITEGPKVTIDEVLVRGNTFTDTRVVLRKAGLRKGQPFSYREILEAQRELYRLGIFQRVDLLPEQAGASVSARDVVIQVDEGKNLTVAGALGYSTEHGFRGTANISHRNLFGKARYVGLEARIAQGEEGREEERFLLTYREPFIFNYDIPLQLTIFRWDEGRPDARFKRIGTYVEASRVFRERTRWSLRYEYKIAECVQGKKCEAATGDIPIPGIPREDQEIEISSVTPSFFWDTRDDPLNPTRGLFASSALEYAFPLYRAETNFIKAFEQGAWYRPVTSRSLIAVSARLGLIEPLKNSGPGSFVPISERFFGGGETSHRGFDLDTLGVEGDTLICLDETTPVPCVEGSEPIALGGNAMLLLNAEYRFPIVGSVGGALFLDTGNVWGSIRDIDFGEMRYAVGTGIRYLTPVGPLRADIGFKLDRKPYEDAYALFITLGYPF